MREQLPIHVRDYFELQEHHLVVLLLQSVVVLDYDSKEAGIKNFRRTTEIGKKNRGKSKNDGQKCKHPSSLRIDSEKLSIRQVR